MQLVKFPDRFSGGSGLQTSFFLSGNCAPWRTSLINKMISDQFYFAIIIDPVYNRYEVEANTRWEYKMIKKCDCVVFWFDNNSLAPGSIFELGVVARDHLKPMIVGISSTYEKREFLLEQLNLYRPDLEVVSTLDEVLTKMEDFVEVFSGTSYDTDYILDTVKPGGTD